MSNISERTALHNAIEHATDAESLRRALAAAVTIIERYESDVDDAERILGVASGFCKGPSYESKYRYLYAMLTLQAFAGAEN